MEDVKDKIMETRGLIGDSNQQDVQLWGKIQEELSNQDEGIRQRVTEMQFQISTLEALMKNHSNTFMRYDALVLGAQNKAEMLSGEIE